LTDGWILTVEFDSIKEMSDQGRYEGENISSSGLGEAADFYGWLVEHWTADSEADIDWATDVVTVYSDTLARFTAAYAWLAENTAPIQIHFTRYVRSRQA
jgi:hypothetical protein